MSVEWSDTVLPHVSHEFTWCQDVAVGQNCSAVHPKSAKTVREKMLTGDSGLWLVFVSSLLVNVKTLRGTLPRTPWPSLENFLHNLTPLGSTEREMGSASSPFILQVRQTGRNGANSHFHLLCVSNIVREAILTTAPIWLAWEVLEIFSQSVVELSTWASHCIW